MMNPDYNHLRLVKYFGLKNYFFLPKAILFFTILCNTSLSAQLDTNKKPYSFYEIEEEKKITTTIQRLVNSTDNRDEGYQLTHKELNSKKFRSARFKADLNLILVAYFNRKSESDSSIYYAQKVLSFGNFSNDTLKNNIHGLAYHWLGTINNGIGLYEKSKKWHLKGIEISQEFSDKRIEYVNSFGLANTYFSLGELDNALELYKKSIEYTGNEELVYGCLVNIAGIYASKEEYNKAAPYYKKALDICKKKNKQSCIGVISYNLGLTEKKQGKLEEALNAIETTITIAQGLSYHQMLIMALIEKGRILGELKKFEEGEKAMLTALEKAKELGLLDDQKTIYFRLRELATLQNRYEQALQYTDQYNEVMDSIQQLDKDKEINELEVRYRTIQKEKEIEYLQIENKNKQLALSNQTEAINNLKLKQEIEKKESEIAKKESQNKILAFQRESEKRSNEINLLKKDQELKQSSINREKSIKNTILYSFLIILFPIIGLLILYYQKLQTQSQLNEKQKEVNKQKIESLIKDQELELVKANLDGQDKERKRIAQELHDSIGGNLAAIKLQLNNFVKEQKALSIINDQIDDTYQQVRDISHTLIPKKFRNNNFCDILEEYLTKIGQASNLSTSFSAYPKKSINNLDENIQVEVFKIIQELITNTIKHAQAKTIELQLNYREHQLNILFEDDGQGFDASENSIGLGLKNIISRIKNISGTINLDSTIGRGTIINIEIEEQKSILNDV